MIEVSFMVTNYPHKSQINLLALKSSVVMLLAVPLSYVTIGIASVIIFVGHASCQNTEHHERLQSLPDLSGAQSGGVPSRLRGLTSNETQSNSIIEQIQGNPVIGSELFSRLHCLLCHSTESSLPLGPNISLDEEEYSDAYLRESIMNPGAVVRDGYDNIMPSFNYLTENEVADLIAFIRSYSE